MSTPIRFVIVSLSAAALTACSFGFKPERKDAPLLNPDEVGKPRQELSNAINTRPLSTAPYIKVRQSDDGARSEPVHIGNEVPLRSVLELAMHGYEPLPQDEAVDMNLPVRINTDSMPVLRFMDILTAATGYDYEIQGKRILVKAYASKQWLLPVFTDRFKNKSKVKGSTTQSGTVQTSGTAAGGTATTNQTSTDDQRGVEVTYESDVDEWDAIVANADRIMGSATDRLGAGPNRTDSAGNTVSGGNTAKKADNSEVVANRTQGLIRAYGPIAKLRRLDAYLRPLIDQGSKQVALDVREIEVNLNDEKAHGINWTAIIKQVFNNAGGTALFTLGGAFPGSTSSNGLSINSNVRNADDTVNSLVNLLSSYGDVQIRNEPQVTQLNGRTAYVGSGEEFGYIASIQQTVTNGIALSTPTIQRLLVGVELAITPRILEDDRIMLEVVPIISTFKNFDTFSVSGNQFAQPRIVLNQFATNVITRSGEPIQLGGLITSALAKNLTTVPIKEGVFLKAIEPVFGGADNTLSRRELVIVVTPTLQGI